jgi:hypothetical protein
MTPGELRAGMAHFTGTEQWHRYNPMFRQLLLTDGPLDRTIFSHKASPHGRFSLA